MKANDIVPHGNALVYPAKTTLAAVLALLMARLLGLPEAYWAAISALIVVQADFQKSLATSWQRLAGTALGATIGAIIASNLNRDLAVYGFGVLAVGASSSILRLERPGNRFAAVAFTIVVLIARPEPPWRIAFHRFLEVSAGIIAGLALSALWPEAGRVQPGPPSRAANL